jgi:hypothetical protein
MKRVVVITLKISAVLALVGYAIFQRQVVDLTGVFGIDKKFRTETKYIVIHHDNIYRDCSVLEIEVYHRDTCDYKETGFAYDIYIKDGKVYLVHDLDAYNAATLGYNHNTIAVCIHSEDKTKLSSQIALILTLRYLMYRYGLNKECIKGHCDLNNTKCPELDLNRLKKWL